MVIDVHDVHTLDHCHFVDYDVYGFDGVFFAYFASALGRIPKQVLQGTRQTIHTFLLQSNSLNE